jgi:hypothetical protein
MTEIAACSGEMNAKQRGGDWQMRIDNARYKLKPFYPKIRLKWTATWSLTHPTILRRCTVRSEGLLAEHFMLK